MEISFVQQPNAPPVPSAAQQPFGLVVPGISVRTEFAPVDPTNMKFALKLTCPGDINVPLASITEIVFFSLPNVPLPPDHGVLCYWQIAAAQPSVPGQEPPSTGFELLGAITPDRPSVVFHTGWSEHEQLMEVSSSGQPVVVTIGASLEPLPNIQNIGAIKNPSENRLYVAQKIAADLYKYMQSFDTGQGGHGQMVVPNNIFDLWFQRFENRFRRDPNFFLKSSDD